MIRHEAWVKIKKRGVGGAQPPLWKQSDAFLLQPRFWDGFETSRIAVSSRGCGHNDGV